MSTIPEFTHTNQTDSNTLEALMQARISRRGALKAGAAAAAATVGSAALDLVTNSASAVVTPTTFGKAAESTSFAAVAPARTTDDAFRVPVGYVADVLLRWGDPVLPGAPKFDPAVQSAQAQTQQCGYNHDFQAFFPIGDGSTEGVLFVNHEYADPYRMIPGWNPRTTNLDQLRAWVDIELAAHGATVVELARANATSKWEVRPGKRNRRITANTPMRMSGPAAQDERLAGQVLGTLNNCGGGVTPWGTVLTAEENFNQYFANNDKVTDAVTKAAHARYGLLPAASDRGWERAYPNRFDASIAPNEPFKFGWIVEVDPDDPASTPVKRTALGRFKHEAATVVVAPSGQIVVYSGDDERFEFFYKFVSYGVYDPKKGKANGALLDDGTLYVAKLEADGSAQWIPLEHNRRGELTARTGFRDQADVLLRTRLAATAVGATRMDRPEDVETNPKTGKVYALLTNNARRTTLATDAAEVAANPRFDAREGNKTGHILELTEKNNDHTSMQFRWDIFMLAGNPRAGGKQVTALKDVASWADTYFAGFAGEVSPLGAPDNVAFSPDGMMWIATDGAPNTIGYNDALHAVATTGPNRGQVRQFLSVPAGAETCGPEFTPDQKTLFVAVQHPGEDGGFFRANDVTANAQSAWPDGANTQPRPATVVIRKLDGGIIGS